MGRGKKVLTGQTAVLGTERRTYSTSTTFSTNMTTWDSDPVHPHTGYRDELWTGVLYPTDDGPGGNG